MCQTHKLICQYFSKYLYNIITVSDEISLSIYFSVHQLHYFILFIIVYDTISLNTTIKHNVLIPVVCFLYFHRFICKQPRMDVIKISARPAVGHCWFSILWKIGVGPQIPDGIVHARRESRRRSVQERNIRGRSQSPVVNQR